MAPTWRQKKMDNLKKWGVNSLCSVGSSFGDIPRKAKSTPTVDIPSVLNIHPSKPCNFEDSICYRDERVPAVRAWCPRYHMQLWLHSTCNRSCYRWAAVCNEFLPSTSRTSHVSCQVIPANPEETGRIMVSTSKWNGLNDLSHMRFQSKFQRSLMPLHLAHGRLSNWWWHVRQLGLHTKPFRQVELPTKSQFGEQRSMAAAVFCLVSQTMPSPESSQESVAVGVHSCSLVSLFRRARSCVCAVLCISFASLVLASSGTKLFLSVRPAFRAEVAFLSNKQLPCWDVDSGSYFDLCLLSCHACHHLSLSCLSCCLCQSCPPPRTAFGGLRCRPEFRFEPTRT